MSSFHAVNCLWNARRQFGRPVVSLEPRVHSVQAEKRHVQHRENAWHTAPMFQMLLLYWIHLLYLPNTTSQSDLVPFGQATSHFAWKFLTLRSTKSALPSADREMVRDLQNNARRLHPLAMECVQSWIILNLSRKSGCSLQHTLQALWSQARWISSKHACFPDVVQAQIPPEATCPFPEIGWNVLSWDTYSPTCFIVQSDNESA